VLLFVALFPAPAPALDGFPGVEAWTSRFAETRKVVDRLVVCFDEPSFLGEIAAWNGETFWPVLLWDSDLSPKFARAFRPAEVRFAAPKEGGAALPEALAAVAGAWEISPAKGPADFLAALGERGRAPLGAVLLAEGSPELLGGAALAAGRFHLPLPFPAGGGHEKVVTDREVDGFRKDLAAAIEALGISFRERGDDLDFVTVANDLCFGYTRTDPDAHPGGYTTDDAIARRDDGERWGWVGRLAGGPERSVHMAMCALFLQPAKGLFFSRYDPNDRGGFGLFDPQPALPNIGKFFPVEAIRHPDATLARWREVQWPAGNRFGFVHVNSSGGATDWSTSKGGATYFDVPDSVPAVVHYTHSGSAAAPFRTDTIAGRWMANGAYVYFGSYSEPYLGSFVPPSLLAERAAAGVPLGAAMRLLGGPQYRGSRRMPVGGVEKDVSFDMAAPWKLAYFGDPAYRLTGPAPARAAPEGAASEKKPKRLPKDRPLAGIAVPLLFPDVDPESELKTLARTLKLPKDPALVAGAQRDVVRLHVAALRSRMADGTLYGKKAVGALAFPAAALKTIEAGAASPEAARLLVEFAKEYAAGIALHPESDVAREKPLALPVLVLACSLPHPDGYRKHFFEWVTAAAKDLGIETKALREKVLAAKWLPEAARKAVTDSLK
jgi:hypothetical protein